LSLGAKGNQKVQVIYISFNCFVWDCYHKNICRYCILAFQYVSHLTL